MLPIANTCNIHKLLFSTLDNSAIHLVITFKIVNFVLTKQYKKLHVFCDNTKNARGRNTIVMKITNLLCDFLFSENYFEDTHWPPNKDNKQKGKYQPTKQTKITMHNRKKYHENSKKTITARD